MKKVITFGTFVLFHVVHLNISEPIETLVDSLVFRFSDDQLRVTLDA
jgi:glycerol-3-phosphate cytidylyltransferase-like family protein